MVAFFKHVLYEGDAIVLYPIGTPSTLNSVLPSPGSPLCVECFSMIFSGVGLGFVCVCCLRPLFRVFIGEYHPFGVLGPHTVLIGASAEIDFLSFQRELNPRLAHQSIGRPLFSV